MKILVTGAKGFVGKNLVAQLKNLGYNEIYEYDREAEEKLLYDYTKECDFVYHLAGVNRPQSEEEYMEGNYGFTRKLIEALIQNENRAPILYASSIQAELDNPYGRSKKAAEDLLFEFQKSHGNKVLVYRLSNLFGKWSRPNYNSVVATFCYNIANDLPIEIRDPNAVLRLVYIDDVVDEFIRAMNGQETRKGQFCEIPRAYTIRLGDLAEMIYSFKQAREDLSVPKLSDEFVKKLHATYLSYLPKDKFGYKLKMNVDHRGSFTEFLKTPDRGQISINIIKPGIVKGNHWHNTKNEKFLVVSGKGVIRLRRVDSSEVIEYHVSGEELQVVDIPPGYTHNIENTGDADMVVIIWANEPFDPDKPDTYYLEV